MSWRDVQPLPQSTDAVQNIQFVQAQQARYVRLLVTRPATSHGYILS